VRLSVHRTPALLDVLTAICALNSKHARGRYTTTFDPRNNRSHTFTKGITRDAYISVVRRGGLFIEHVVPKVYPRHGDNSDDDDYPVERVTTGTFDVITVAHLFAPSGARGALTVVGSWPHGETTATTSVVLLPGERRHVTLNLTAVDVLLWFFQRARRAASLERHCFFCAKCDLERNRRGSISTCLRKRS
jgi:hypothetical protein